MNVNYNLLKVLNALLDEVHVTKAGTRVFLTQAATSNALNQLRDVFKDQLLVRKGAGKMQLTPFAKSLIPDVCGAFEAVERVFNRSDNFDSTASQRDYVILTSSYIEPSVLHLINRQFHEEAPHARLEIRQIDCKNVCKIREIDADLFIGINKLDQAQFSSIELYEDCMAIFVSSDHPINSINNLSLKDIAAYSIIHEPADQLCIDKIFGSQKLHNRSMATSEIGILDLILDYNYIGCLPWRQVMYLKKRFDLNILDNISDYCFEHPSNKFKVYMNWKSSLDDNSESLWLRKLISVIV